MLHRNRWWHRRPKYVNEIDSGTVGIFVGATDGKLMFVFVGNVELYAVALVEKLMEGIKNELSIGVIKGESGGTF